MKGMSDHFRFILFLTKFYIKILNKKVCEILNTGIN